MNDTPALGKKELTTFPIDAMLFTVILLIYKQELYPSGPVSLVPTSVYKEYLISPQGCLRYTSQKRLSHKMLRDENLFFFFGRGNVSIT